MNDLPTIDYTPESEKRADKLRVRQAESKSRMAGRARQRQHEAVAAAMVEDGPMPAVRLGLAAMVFFIHEDFSLSASVCVCLNYVRSMNLYPSNHVYLSI